MSDKPTSIDTYMASLPEDRVAVISKLRAVFQANLPDGFEEMFQYGMIGYVVPLARYPQGYHCDTKMPLPFISIASQKNFVAIYHMGIYADTELLSWFTTAYVNRVKGKLDMGKSCIRFKKIDQIPYELLGELLQKMTVEQWVDCYEKTFRSQSKK